MLDPVANKYNYKVPSASDTNKYKAKQTCKLLGKIILGILGLGFPWINPRFRWAIQRSIYKINTQGYLDKHNFLKGKEYQPKIKPEHSNWYMQQALIREAKKTADPTTQKQLDLLLLHGHSKAAPVSRSDAKDFALQCSPFANTSQQYHRSTYNTLLNNLASAYEKMFKLPFKSLLPLDSLLFKEVVDREVPNYVFKNPAVESYEEFEAALDQVFAQTAAGHKIKYWQFLDISSFIAKKGGLDNAQGAINELEMIFRKKMNTFIGTLPEANKTAIAKNIVDNVRLRAFGEVKGQPILLIPTALNWNGIVKTSSYDPIDKMMIHAGFRVGPDKAKESWLAISDLETILQKSQLPYAELATHGAKIPKVVNSWNEFLDMPIFQKFKNFKNLDGAPHSRILRNIAVSLLEGFRDMQVEKVYQDKQIDDLLQISCFRIQNAMNEIILRHTDVVEVNNQLDLIHQEIQNILAIVQPYDENELGSCLAANSLVSPAMPAPKGYLKNSAMRCVASIISAAAAQKGTSILNVAVLKDSYYESVGAMSIASHYTSTLDGDKFNAEGIDQAFITKPAKPIDLFLCEFHHNISVTRRKYTPEDVIGQILAMHEKGLLAEKCTVAIDNTIDVQDSDKVKELFNHPKIQELVQQGRLNIVLYRSSQKFDQAGQDNYYGGLALSVNKAEDFTAFNARMDHKDDQLSGLSYQGITHIQKHASKHIEAYRKAIMWNTQWLYKQLPAACKYFKGNKNVFQVSDPSGDDKLVFLDIKTSNGLAKPLERAFEKFVDRENLPLMHRSSFGYALTNLIGIGCTIRLTPGLEGYDIMSKYASFFHEVQEVLDKEMPKVEKLDEKIRDAHLARVLAKHFK